MTSRFPLLLLLLSFVVGAICIRLGVWQLDRLSARKAANAIALAQRSLPATDASDVTGSGANRRVVATGRFDFGREFVLRGRARDGVPGVEVVTPLLEAGHDTAVLVLRGYVPSADAISYDAELHREPDSIRVSGIAWPIPVDSSGASPSMRQGAETWRRLDLGSVRRRLPYPVAPFYIIADSPATASPAPLRSAAPPLDDGPHLNYAIQWFAFATIAFGGAGAVWWQRRRGALLPQVPGAG